MKVGKEAKGEGKHSREGEGKHSREGEGKHSREGEKGKMEDNRY